MKSNLVDTPCVEMSKTEYHLSPRPQKNSWNKAAAGSVTDNRYTLPRAVYWQLIARPTFCRGLTGRLRPAIRSCQIYSIAGVDTATENDGGRFWMLGDARAG